MSFNWTPLCSSDCSRVATWALFCSSASTAVCAVVLTPMSNVAVSGVPSTSPLPVTVIVAGEVAEASWDAVSTVRMLADRGDEPALLSTAEPTIDPTTTSAATPAMPTARVVKLWPSLRRASALDGPAWTGRRWTGRLRRQLSAAAQRSLLPAPSPPVRAGLRALGRSLGLRSRRTLLG